MKRGTGVGIAGQYPSCASASLESTDERMIDYSISSSLQSAGGISLGLLSRSAASPHPVFPILSKSSPTGAS
jgi:hypothetical protein